MKNCYGYLAGEPWGMTPDQIADLTDYQIEHVYIRPESERREAQRRAAEGKPPQQPGNEKSVAESEITEEDFVAGARAIFGGTEEQWRAEYHRQQQKGGG